MCILSYFLFKFTMKDMTSPAYAIKYRIRLENSLSSLDDTGILDKILRLLGIYSGFIGNSHD